jgi:hypothetical protein
MAANFSKSDHIAGERGSERAALARRVVLEIVPPVPPEVPVASSITFIVRASCAEASDLCGGRVEIRAAGQVVAEPALVAHRDGFTQTAAIEIRAPAEIGAHGLTVVFPRQKIGEDVYEEILLPVSFRTIPHGTSLAVWAVPSPVPVGGAFSVTVGAKSSGACDLKGAKVEIVDEAGGMVHCGSLGNMPWPGTAGLFWTKIALNAPSSVGTFAWQARFPAQELGLAHDGSSATFGFTTVEWPAHRLTVKVTESDGAVPIADVEIALGPYRAATDTAGLARLDIPAGRFDLAVWKSGFEGAPKTVEIAGDVALEVAMTRVPQEPAIWDELL